MSQARLAEIVGLTPVYICNIEVTGKAVSFTALVSIADALGVTADVFIYGNQKVDAKEYQSELAELLLGCDEFERRTHL